MQTITNSYLLVCKWRIRYSYLKKVAQSSSPTNWTYVPICGLETSPQWWRTRLLLTEGNGLYRAAWERTRSNNTVEKSPRMGSSAPHITQQVHLYHPSSMETITSSNSLEQRHKPWPPLVSRDQQTSQWSNWYKCFFPTCSTVIITRRKGGKWK